MSAWPWLSLAVLAPAAAGIESRPDEAWYAARLAARLGVPGLDQPPDGPGIWVLRRDHGRCERRRSVLLTPLRLGGQTFERGLGTHANSRWRLRPPAAARRFRATVGVDWNYDTAGRRGTVEFAVSAGDRELWRSGRLDGASPPATVDLEIGGIETLDLHCLDAGDGVSWDQADWAEARLALADGSTVWLDELPIHDDTWLADGVPLSLDLDGRSSDVGTWPLMVTPLDTTPDRAAWRLVRRHEPSGLELICEVILHRGRTAVEWTTALRQTGEAPSPLITRFAALDLTLRRAGGPRETAMVQAARGSNCAPDDFEPLEIPLVPRARVDLSAGGGRSSNRHLPFFAVDAVDRGFAFGVGWSGQWRADILADEQGYGSRTTVGLEHLAPRLAPGESIRGPRLLAVPFDGPRLRGCQALRAFLWERVTPDVGGERPWPEVQSNSWFAVGDDGNLADEANQIELLEAWRGLGLEVLVMDAGWFEGGWPNGAGSWVPRADTFPRGLRPVGEAAERAGIRFGLWFEPERVAPGSILAREHPEWLLGDPAGQRLLNLGLSEVQDWFVETVSSFVEQVPLGYFRHDFNIDPLPFWQQADGTERVGMTEIRYIEGLYAIWDRLRERFPDLIIEGCASGGRRIDLESLRRCHIYWKTDLYADHTANQAHVHGASLWLPGCYLNTPLLAPPGDEYAFRSLLGGALCSGWDPRGADFDRAAAARQIERFISLRHLFSGDFRPLLPHTPRPEGWAGYQFTTASEGLALFFRRTGGPFVTAEIHLGDLDPGAVYELRDEDSGQVSRQTGADLMRPRRVTIEETPGSRMWTWRRVGGG